MRYALLAFCAAVLVTGVVSVAGDPPKLGAEWSYDKEMRHFKKMMPIEVNRPSAGLSGQNYHFNLQHDKVLASDSDDNTSTSLRVNDTICLEIRKNPKGGPVQVQPVNSDFLLPAGTLAESPLHFQANPKTVPASRLFKDRDG